MKLLHQKLSWISICILFGLLSLIIFANASEGIKPSFALTMSSEGEKSSYQISSKIDYTDSNYSATIPSIPNSVNYDVDIVFLGINESQIINSFVDRLPQWYAPVDTMEYLLSNYKKEYDLNFTLSYHLHFLNPEKAKDYRTYLCANSAEDRSPWFIQPEQPTARYIHSDLAENYLSQNVVVSSNPTLIIIDTYSFDPVGHTPYYYNASYNELDEQFAGSASNPIPWASTYQIAGGGADSRLLWLDLSAGSTVYHSYGASTVGEVNDSSIPPIWSYDNNASSKFTDDLTKYVATALETRLLPSYGYLPWHIAVYEEMKFEMLLVDLDPSNFDFLSKINGDYIVAEYQRVNPFINWTYSLSEWEWASDPGFVYNLETYTDHTSKIYSLPEILAYLDSNYRNIFNSSSSDTQIIPIFLFALPSGYGVNPDWGGFCRTVSGEFAYIYSKITLDDADLAHVETGTNNLDDIPFNQLTPGSDFVISEYGGRHNEIIDLSVTINTGSMNLYLVDDYNYYRFNQSLPFTDLLNNSLSNLSNITSTQKTSFSSHIFSLYHLILEDSGNTALNFDLNITISTNLSRGYTWKTMHEIGHALGLNHPHNGFSWGNYDHSKSRSGMYLDWLWDMSYSQTNYAYNAPTISIMDIDTLMRGAIPYYWKNATHSIAGLYEAASNKLETLPEKFTTHLARAIDYLNQSIDRYSLKDELNHYLNSLELIFEMNDELVLARAVLENAATETNQKAANWPFFTLLPALILATALTRKIRR